MESLLIIGTISLFLTPLTMASGRNIVPLDEPYDWITQLSWNIQNFHSLVSFSEDGNVNGTLRLGSYSANFIEDLPIIAGSFATNINTDYIKLKYAIGLNLYFLDAVVLSDYDGNFRYQIRNWIPFLDGTAALGISFQGSSLDFEKIGVTDDPEEWRNSILWSNGNALSASVGIKDGKVTAGLQLGGGQGPKAIATASGNIDQIKKGDFSQGIKYGGGLYSSSFQGLLLGEGSQIRYIVNPNIQKYGEIDGHGKAPESLASLGVIVQGDNRYLSTWGGATSILGLAMNFQLNDGWNKVKEISVMI